MDTVPDDGGQMPKVTDQELPELWGAKESAAFLGVATSNLRATAGLPEPVAQLASGPIYRADEIRELAERRRKAKGDG